MSIHRISRRRVLAGAAAIATVPKAAFTAQEARPNIVWLVSEDNGPFIGAYGDRLARTPTIDRLAAEGILYRNVFSTAPVCAPSRFGIITGVLPESCGPAHHMRATALLPALLRGFPEYLRKAGYYCTNNVKTDYNSDLDPAKVWDESSGKAHWRNRPGNAPFFAVFNSMTTHESRLIRGPAPGNVKPEQVRVPAYLPDTPEVRQDIASYYNLMEQMDSEVGAKLAELEAAGLREDTIVFYYSDNGGILPRSKRYCYDEGLRCPMVAHVPKKWAHLVPAGVGSEVRHPVTLLDMAPTVLALAGVPVPAHMQGKPLLGTTTAVPPSAFAFGMRNRMDERYDMVRTATDGRFRYIRNYMPHRIHGQQLSYPWQIKSYQAWERAHEEGKLNAAQERFWGEKPFEEFYDLQIDPDQVRNLVGVTELQPRLAQMRKALDEHMLRVNDNGFIPEGSLLEGYEASRVPGAYPLQRIMELAATAARRDPARVGELRKALGDANEVVRHWGAQGLLMLGRESARALPELRKMLGDSLAQNQVVAAEALVRLTKSAEPVQLLGELLESHPHPRVRLQALNSLTYIGSAARPILPLIERVVGQSADEYIKGAGKYLVLSLKGEYRAGVQTFDTSVLDRLRKQTESGKK